ncbi:acyltransferase family protein [Mucilaginibacter calamicampi]|uniref:Acyltransferase family protein n=1 Tax=Mucilaginibacter calamicampi TaxID=1302352 RepID=A0ABW2Z062_9SPHI
MTATSKPRLLSLDVFRGATVAAMILVNNPGDWGHIYAPLEHSAWNGCTPTDLIFPFFLFIVGVSIVYAMESKAEVKANHSKMLWGAFRRMLILIVISLVTQLLFHPGFAHLRFPGVLQRIGLVYFISTLIYLKTTQKTRDVLLGALLVGYYLIMAYVPVPDTGKASLDPETNMGAWVDRMVFSTNHLWSESKTWDPEGLLGTLPAIATCLLGVRVGSWLKQKNNHDAVKVSWLFAYGIIAIVTGLIWDLFFPINKALWTSSYVLYSGGWAMVALALCFWLIDVQGHKKPAMFFVPLGVNAITAYVLSNYIPHYITNKKYFGGGNLYQLIFEPYIQPYVASALSGLLLVFIIWALMRILYKRNIVIKV